MSERSNGPAPITFETLALEHMDSRRWTVSSLSLQALEHENRLFDIIVTTFCGWNTRTTYYYLYCYCMGNTIIHHAVVHTGK
jgi:hypothetical protein